MKSFVIVLLLIPVSVFGQLTLEKTYAGNHRMYLERVDGEGYKFAGVEDATKNVFIYNEDHSLWKKITTGIPLNATILYTLPLYTSKTLFNSDNKIEVFVCYADATGYTAKLFNEDGVTLQVFNDAFAHTIKKSDNGWKLLIYHSSIPQVTDVYSLPGQYVGVQKSDVKEDAETLLYPNPMNDAATLLYNLPVGASSGRIEVYNSAGVLMRSYQVTNQFSSIIVHRGDLPAGNYSYKVIVPGASAAAKQFIVY